MAKAKSVFVCNDCGYESNGWLGKCPSCSSWNTFFEQKTSSSKQDGRSLKDIVSSSKAVPLYDVAVSDEDRVTSGINELDLVLGGGIVKGSLVLVGGDPGIGKSTLIMQVCGNTSRYRKVLYVSGEESASQIKQRAQRLGASDDGNAKKLYILSETCFDVVLETIKEIKPCYLIIDSIQTMYTDMSESAPGSVSQVREVTAGLMKLAKLSGMTAFIVGHVTKEGAIAGPRVLEHMVDTVLYFEGERHLNYRILRAVKNRFGSTNEVGIFEMTGEGLIPVDNPSEMFLGGRQIGVPGTVVVSGMEGSRSLLIEIQALTTETAFGSPRRNVRGIDYNRMTMILAVLEKKSGLNIGVCDVYINVVGGMMLSEPACDLGIAAAVISGFRNVAVDSKTVFIGEVGLTGEIRGVGQIEKRLNEAKRLGFETCIIPEKNMKQLKRINDFKDLKLYGVLNIEQVMNLMIG